MDMDSSRCHPKVSTVKVDDRCTLSAEETADLELYFPQFAEGFEEKVARERKRGRLNGGYGVFAHNISKCTHSIVSESTDPGLECRLTVSRIDNIIQLCEDYSCASEFVDELFRILTNSSEENGGEIMPTTNHGKASSRSDANESNLGCRIK